MSESHPSPKKSNRRVLAFALAMSPFIALAALLVWGQVRTQEAPGGLLEYSEAGNMVVESTLAPNLVGFDAISGDPTELRSLHGDVVMINFWSSWCAVCRSEAADLAAVHREYTDMPVKFLGVAILDQPGNIPPYLRQYSVGYPNIIDEAGASAVTYGVTGVPEKYFLNRKGQVVRKIVGPLSRPALREILDSLIQA